MKTRLFAAKNYLAHKVQSGSVAKGQGVAMYNLIISSNMKGLNKSRDFLFSPVALTLTLILTLTLTLSAVNLISVL